MPRSCNENVRFWEMWMKEFLGYSIVLAAAALHLSPKTIQHYVLRCFSTEEVKACTKFRKTKNSSLYMQPQVKFVIMEAVRLSKEY